MEITQYEPVSAWEGGLIQALESGQSFVVFKLKSAVHNVDRYYRSIGGSGLRTPEPEEDYPLGIECLTNQDTTRLRIICRLVPRDPSDKALLLIKTQAYLNSEEFKTFSTVTDDIV
ncbi:MAG: hypothetical protein WDZ82_01660 [Candidatus Paceibacterota bacterium]